MILGFSLIIIAIAIASKTNRLPDRVAGITTNPPSIDNKFCDDPTSSIQATGCTSFIPSVLAAALTSPYQNVNGDVAISGNVNITGSLVAGAGIYNTVTGQQLVETNQRDWTRWNQGQGSVNGNAMYQSLSLGTGGLAVGTWSNQPVGNIYATGSVGIGTASPGRRLEVNNTIKLTNTGSDANDGVIGVRTFAPGLNIVGIQTEGAGTGRKVQIWGYTTFVNGHNDLAENYFISGKVLRSSLVSIDDSTSSVATLASSLHKSLIGIVSTNPGAVMDADGGFHIGYGTKSQYTDEKAPIALAGTVPTLVTSQNGFISIGDPISLSSLPGFGAKATTAGTIVGKALETFNPANTSCQAVSSLDAIKWPEDNGKNPDKPCFKLPDNTYVGKIMVAVNLSWYDPDIYLTSTNNFHLDLDQLKDAGNNLITRIGAFGKLIAGKIQAGIIETQKLIVNGVDILDKLNKQEQEIAELKTTIRELQQQLQNR